MQVIQKTLGTRIRELRLKRGWSQEEFADICDIHRSHMGEIERGETNLTLSTMLVIAQKLETTISALFRGIA
ncbi:MAG TPA: helix-turn-helix transcriptional regulator [Candidatus Angelobacter sp.]|jgi:transcriptional regulator with XRE-family HTH domain|nr:helix-turn-helix transcriptional regulator [Candidatus Angelobacter sp.]